MEATSFNNANPAEHDSTGLTSPIKVNKAKFNHLIIKPVGDEKLEKILLNFDDGSQAEAEQNYFSGLVYRYDSRNLSEIKKAGGFYPRVPREKNHRVIATSKSITQTNGWKHMDKSYKYMIDTKMNNVRGLDPDYFRRGERPSCEVCFEDPLPYSSIVGYFKNENFKKFYLNNEYQGNFSWSAENIVDHYQNPIPQNHSLVTKKVEIVEKSVRTSCTVQ